MLKLRLELPISLFSKKNENNNKQEVVFQKYIDLLDPEVM